MKKIKFANCNCCVEPGNFDINNIPLDCPATYKLLASGYTVGVFQLEKKLGQEWSSRVKPTNIEDIGALTALIRPGCLESGQTEEYAKIKAGEKEPEYLHPCLREILGPTCGCLVYQEQAIRIAIEIAGFSPENADWLRKAIGKKKAKLMAEVKTKFMEGTEKTGKIGQAVAEQIFGWIEKSQRYSFNKSHAIAYGMLSYATAWAKCHFPVEFFESYLTFSTYKGDTKLEIYQLVQEARFFGIEIMAPDVRNCNVGFDIVREPDQKDSIRFGLAYIRGVGRSAIEKIVSVGADGLKTWQEFLSAVPSLHRNVGIGLVKSGACDCYGMSRAQMVREIEVILGTTSVDEDGKKIDVKGLTDKERSFFFKEYLGDRQSHDILEEMSDADADGPPLRTYKKPELVQMLIHRLGGDIDYQRLKKDDLVQALKDDGYIEPTRICANDKRREEMAKKAKQLECELKDTNLAKAAAEKHFLSVSLSCSAVDDIDGHWKEDAHSTCLDIAKSPNSAKLCACVIIDKVKYTKTKKGRKPGSRMCFLMVSDSTYSIDHAVVFPTVFDECKGMCKEDNIVIIHGYKKNGSLIVENMQKII